MSQQHVGVGLLVCVVAVALAAGKPTDPDTLAAVGQVVGRKAYEALPDRSKVVAPLSTLRIAERLPLDEQIRNRLQTDKLLAGSAIDVQVTPGSGEVRVKGSVGTVAQQLRVFELADATVGVTRVVNDVTVGDS